MKVLRNKKMSLLFSITVAFGIAIHRESRATIKIEYTVPNEVIPIRKVENNRVKYYLLMQGIFPNTCYLTDKLEYTVSHNNQIFIKNSIRYVFDNFCLMILTPYEQLIKLGALHYGNYSVYVLSSENEWVLVSTFSTH